VDARVAAVRRGFLEDWTNNDYHALHNGSPTTGTPICTAPRPRAHGSEAEHSWWTSTWAPSCSSGGIPSPTAKGSGPLWGLMLC